MLFDKSRFDAWDDTRHSDLKTAVVKFGASKSSKNIAIAKLKGDKNSTYIIKNPANVTDTGKCLKWKDDIDDSKFYILCYEIPSVKFPNALTSPCEITFKDEFGLESIPVSVSNIDATHLTTLYVSSSGSGNDNPGTKDWPCPTLQDAINKCTGTDDYTINIMTDLSGDKARAKTSSVSGLTSGTITIQSSNGDNKELNGNNYLIENALDISNTSVDFKLSKLKFKKYKLALSSFADELTIEDCEFEYNKRAISIAAGTNTLTRVRVSNNTSSGLCAGIRIYKAASISTVPTATLNNCTIKSNTTKLEGSSGEVNNGGGGGLAVVKGATCTLTGGTEIMRCTAERGGGVFIGPKDGSYNTTLNMESATISGNTAHKSGGGIANYCKLQMTGGSITGNFAKAVADYDTDNKGGGIYFGGEGESEISGSSTISENHAHKGAGICSIVPNVTLKMSDGAIKNNVLHDAGGGGGASKGVGKGAFFRQGKFEIADKASVMGNIYLGSVGNNPYLTINDNYTGGDINLEPYNYNNYRGQYLAKATTSNEVFKSTILKKIKLSGPPDLSSTHAIDCKGILHYSAVSVADIKAQEGNMTDTDIIIPWNDVKGASKVKIYYKTNLGSYGWMLISNGDTAGLTGQYKVGKVDFKFITFYGGCNSMGNQSIYIGSGSSRNLDRNDPTKLKAEDWDFNWICENTAPNNIKISSKNGAKFYRVE